MKATKEEIITLLKFAKSFRLINQLYLINNLYAFYNKYYCLNSIKNGTINNTGGIKAYYI